MLEVKTKLSEFELLKFIPLNIFLTLFVLAPSSNDQDCEQKISRLTSMGFTKVGLFFHF